MTKKIDLIFQININNILALTYNIIQSVPYHIGYSSLKF